MREFKIENKALLVAIKSIPLFKSWSGAKIGPVNAWPPYPDFYARCRTRNVPARRPAIPALGDPGGDRTSDARAGSPWTDPMGP